MPKISYVKGRVSQIMKIGGKRILPIDIEEVVAKVDGLDNEFRIILERPEMETLKLRVEYKPEVNNLALLKDRFEEAVFHEMGIKTEIELVPSGSLERVTFKAQRVERRF